MKKILLLIMMAAILLSGCVDKTATAVKTGDNITVDYTGSYENGKVFDTSIKSIAQSNDLPPRTIYEPLKFKVGQKPSAVIEGFEKGVIGMKIGETKTLRIPPEEAYPINPAMIQVAPIVQDLPATRTIPKVFEIPLEQFQQYFGTNHSVGDIVQIPDTNLNITIKNMTSKNLTSEVSLAYNLKVGSNIWDARAPWNETVIKIDDKNITTKPNVTINEIIQFPDAPFNTTVVNIDDKNITLRHNPIPDTTISIPGMFGQMVDMRISFNETSMIMDRNPEVSGKTLIFNVTLVSIDK